MRNTKPNDSYLAKLVGKLMFFIPTFSVGRKIELENKIANMNRELLRQQDFNNKLFKEYRTTFSGIKLAPVPSFGVSSYNDEQHVRVDKISINFEPIYYAFVVDDIVHEILEEDFEYFMEKVCRDIGYEYADQFKKNLLEAVKKKYNLGIKKSV